MLFLRILITDSLVLKNYLIFLNLKTLEYFYLSSLTVLLGYIMKFYSLLLSQLLSGPFSTWIKVFYVHEVFLSYNLHRSSVPLLDFLQQCLQLYVYFFFFAHLPIQPLFLWSFLLLPLSYFHVLVAFLPFFSCCYCISLKSSSLLRLSCLFPSFLSWVQLSFHFFFCFSLHFCF